MAHCYNPWESIQERTARIKREVMTHFSHHHMYELCNDELYSKACAVLKEKKLCRNFYNITGAMKELYKKESGYDI